MDRHLILWLSVFLICSVSQPMNGADLEAYLGKWSLHLPQGAGWLDIRQEEGYLDADILWKGGSVVPVSHIYYLDGKVYIDRTSAKTLERKNDRSQQVTKRLELEAGGDQLIGRYVEPTSSGSAKTTVFYAVRIPRLPQAPDLNRIKYGAPVKLFDGHSLDGWQSVPKDRMSAWSVENGVLVNDPSHHTSGDRHVRTSNLRSDAVFEDFNLTIEVNIPKGSNSGVYLRGIYEVQVMDSYRRELDSHHMGALYSRITPTTAAERPPGEWQELDMILCKRHLTVSLNGVKIIDNQPIEGVTGGALSADQFSPGPIYLQGDHGTVKYRNVVLRPIVN